MTTFFVRSMPAKSKPPLESVIALFVLGAFVIFLRSPQGFSEAVLYAEDGSWISLLMKCDFTTAYLHSRSDYFVWGNILLLHLSLSFNHLFFGYDISHLAQICAAVSYSFYSLLAVLTYIAVSSFMSRGFSLILWMLILLMPVGRTSHEIFGYMVQVGYSFVYLTVITVILREDILKPGFSLSVLILDVVIFIAIGTNPVSAGVLAAYLVFRLYQTVRAPASEVFDHYPEASAATRHPHPNDILLTVFAGSLTSYLAWRMMQAGSNSDLSGVPFAWGKAVEAAIARPMLYPFVFPFYSHLTDRIALAIALVLALLVCLGWLTRRGRSIALPITFSGLLIFTAAGTGLRPGLSSFFADYAVTGVDRYYYGQNLIAMLLMGIALDRLVRSRRLFLAGIAGWLILVATYVEGLPSLFELGTPGIPIRTGPSFVQDLQTTAKQLDFKYPDLVFLPIYPRIARWGIYVPRRYVEATVSPAFVYDRKIVHQPPANRRQMDGLFVVSDGRKEWIANGEWLGRNGFRARDVVEIPSDVFDAIPTLPGALE